MATRPFSVRFYTGLSRLLYPLVQPLLLIRRKRGKEDSRRMPERKGIASLPRPDGVLIWLHGASVGEIISLLPIAEHFTAAGVQVLVTSGTVTSAEVAKRRLPSGVLHQYLPLDLPAYVDRFLAHWRPDIGVFAESELWPNLIHAAHDAGTHLVIVNARMSERSFRHWQRLPSFITSMLSRFELVLAQSSEDSARLRALGASRAPVIGNLKYDAPPPPADPADLAALAQAIGSRPVFVAASTHAGEEEQIAKAHRLASASVKSLLTILIPRHPERGDAVAQMLASSGLTVARRQTGALPDSTTDIYIADTIGELGLFYRLSKLAYLGGSLVPHGGQNPIEAAKLGNGILHGPHIHNFTEVYGILQDHHAALQVEDADSLGRAVVQLLSQPAILERMAGLALSQMTQISGAVRQTLEALEPLVLQARIVSSSRAGDRP